MPDVNLTQDEADTLIAMDKVRVDNQQYYFPSPGGSVCAPLTSVDKRENFLLDIGRGRINLAKVKYQNRARQVVVLVRLDIEGSPHRNPDGQEVPPPHLHVYREGYGDKWAIPVPVGHFSDIADPFQVMDDFMSYCKVTQPPFIERGLFS